MGILSLSDSEVITSDDELAIGTLSLSDSDVMISEDELSMVELSIGVDELSTLLSSDCEED